MIRDVRATGEMAGILLVQNLCDVADGKLPMNSPLGGVAREEGDARFMGVHFMTAEREADDFPFVAPGPLRHWLARPGWCDAVLIHHLPELREFHVLFPACGSRDWFDLVVWFGYRVAGGEVRVSSPAWQRASTIDNQFCREVLDAMDAGISRHGSAARLEPSWGALGSYLGLDRVPTACDEATARLHDPLIALGRQRRRHRLWPGAVTFDERDRHVASIENQAPDVAFPTCLDALYANGIGLVYGEDEL